jgi:crotonobetainyl-CoA:carnitine CoA-transferase CaiB-like acyl-CoA transferase
MTRPLDGVRVIDLTVVLSGTAVTATLGDLGAEVIRVESRRHFPTATKGPRRVPADVEPLGNTRRGYADRRPGDRPWERNALPALNARGKRSITFEIAEPRGRELFLQLVGISDVLVENNSPGFLERRGIGPDALWAANPELIIARLPGAADYGPAADVRAMGPTFEAWSGLAALRAWAGAGTDIGPDTMYMDATTVPAAVTAVAAALRARRRARPGPAKGCLVVVSQMGVMMDHGAPAYAESDRVAAATRPNDDPHQYPHGVYRSAGADEWVAIAGRDDADWERLCAIVGTDGGGPAPVPPTADLAARRAEAAAIDDWLSAWTVSRTKADIVNRLQHDGVPAAPVLRESEFADDPHVRSRGFFRPVTDPVVGTRPHPGPAWVSRAWAAPATAIAGLGSDNEYVVRELLGWPAAAYAALVADGDLGNEYDDPNR